MRGSPSDTALPDSLLRAVYSGVLETRPWTHLGELCCERTHSTCCTMVTYWQMRKEFSDLTVHGMDDDAQALRRQYLATQDFDPQRYLTMAPGQVYELAQLLTPDEIRHGSFYRDFLRANGMDHILCLPISEPGGFRAWLNVGRKDPFGPYSDQDKAFFLSLAPHLETALACYGALKRTEMERDIYRSLAEHLGVGLIVLDQDGRAMNANATASQILDSGRTGMGINGRKLGFDRRSLNDEFQQLFTAALQGEYGVMKVPVAGRQDVGLLLRPLPPAIEYAGRDLPRVLIYFSDPLTDKLAPPQLMAKLFGLTPAEAALALKLAEGLTLAEAAQQSGISESSARSYLKRIFTKIGIHRQSELVALILKSTAILALPKAS